MIRRLFAIAALAWLLAPGAALAVLPDEQLADPALEGRARVLSQGLRCVVCQSENIDESNAELARDMRIRLRELLVAGKSDDEAVGYMVERYGDYVLMKPPFKATTLALWLGPFALLLVGALGIGLYYRRRGPIGAESAPPALSAAERQRLDHLLADDEPPASPSDREAGR
ncbi:cytochrome C biogenesis protein CcmH [Rhodospirillum rubrum]|uniref:cytochrome c-type biogenesis protein n=1 Tax=Rhodospirillum rubrum TaxID=1085 RepID=UPI001906D692|nr:cytochrome c-type biogenesis protein [Rhodospirillum rubrum]MBK1664999.1 cytochrome C biogenesis protein CcmH [Rhodospirillum rubrum]MBK1678587.1 cytochrome C biogenesis protein CcmH [Rhodospirillum rubrum]